MISKEWVESFMQKKGAADGYGNMRGRSIRRSDVVLRTLFKVLLRGPYWVTETRPRPIKEQPGSVEPSCS